MYAPRHLRRNATPTEDLLWRKLRGRKLAGMKIRRQHPIGRLVLDFYCPEVRLAIEVDGSVHLGAERQVADKDRDELLDELGIQTLRVTADDVEFRIESVLETILKALESRKTTTSPSPLHGEGAGG